MSRIRIPKNTVKLFLVGVLEFAFLLLIVVGVCIFSERPEGRSLYRLY